MKTINLSDLGKNETRQFGYFGMDGNCFKLDGRVYEAIEDPSDGYRSSLEEVRLVEDPKELAKLVFPKRRIDTVIIVEGVGDFSGHNLVSVGDVAPRGYVWADIGTSHADDYYPSFVCTHLPYEPPAEETSRLKEQVRILQAEVQKLRTRIKELEYARDN